RIERAKRGQNPLFIELDDDEPAPGADRFAELERELGELERKAASPPARAGAAGRIELLGIQTAFAPSDHARTRALVGRSQAAIDEAHAELGPGVEIGLTGNATTTLHEHDSVLDGMARSIGLTVALCAAALLLYYRSARLVLAMLWALAVG